MPWRVEHPDSSQNGDYISVLHNLVNLRVVELYLYTPILPFPAHHPSVPEGRLVALGFCACPKQQLPIRRGDRFVLMSHHTGTG